MNTRLTKLAALATTVLLLLPLGEAVAQTVELRIHVTLEDGSAVPGALVVLKDVDGEPLASRLGFVDVFMTTPTGLDPSHSIELDGVRHLAALEHSAYATADSGVYSFPFAGDERPQLHDPVDGAFSLDVVGDFGAIVVLENEWRAYFGLNPPVRIGGITPTPGDIANARGGVPYAGTRSTEPVCVFSDANQSKIGRVILVSTTGDVPGVEVRYVETSLGDDPLTEDLQAPESLAINSAGTVIATFPLDDAIVAFSVDLGAGCTPGLTTACTLGDRFELEADWRDFQGNTGQGVVVPGGSEDSEIFSFFDPDNWEMLVKVLDGCGLNDRFWVFSAATTNVEYTLRVTDTSNGQVREYFNPLGQAAPALTDTSAFECGR